MTGRPRFCGVCGARVGSSSETLEWTIAYCATHRALVKQAETPPRDPLELLPTLAAELAAERADAAGETGRAA